MSRQIGNYTMQVHGKEVVLKPGAGPFTYHVYRHGRYFGMIALHNAAHGKPMRLSAINAARGFMETFDSGHGAIAALVELIEGRKAA